jgi:hypothetical protein
MVAMVALVTSRRTSSGIEGGNPAVGETL